MKMCAVVLRSVLHVAVLVKLLSSARRMWSSLIELAYRRTAHVPVQAAWAAPDARHAGAPSIRRYAHSVLIVGVSVSSQAVVL